MAVQPWDAMQAWATKEEWIGYCRLNAIKYLARNGCKDNNALEDTLKAQDYIAQLIKALQK